MIYSEVERKEIEHVYGVFKDYIHASKFLDFVWSEKLGYLLLHIDPTENTIEEDQIIASADELCAELFNEVATDVFQEAKREHFYPDADDDEMLFLSTADRGRPRPKEVFIYGRRASARKKWYLLCGTDLQNL